MKSIITEEVLDQIWETGHKRVMSFLDEKKKYPTLVEQIDNLKKEYIICMNSISVRDYNRIEKTRKVINTLEAELEELKSTYDADQKRFKKAKQIKEDASIEVIETESEEK